MTSGWNEKEMCGMLTVGHPPWSQEWVNTVVLDGKCLRRCKGLCFRVHCIIQQESLCGKSVKMQHVMVIIVEAVNYVRAHGLNQWFIPASSGRDECATSRSPVLYSEVHSIFGRGTMPHCTAWNIILIYFVELKFAEVLRLTGCGQTWSTHDVCLL